MDRETLLQIQRERILREETSDDSMEEIVELLGGIDLIVLNHLEQLDIKLDEITISELHKIICRPAKTLILSDDNDTQIGSVENIRKLKVSLNLETNNTYLYKLLEYFHYINIYSKLVHAIYHKITSFCLLISIILWFIFVGTGNVILFSSYIIITAIIFWLPFCIFWLLAVNRLAFNYILKSFDFWIKVIYMLIWGICEIIHRFILQKGTFINQLYGLAFITYFLFDLTAILGLIIISSFDGFETKKIWTIVMSAIFAFITIGYSFYYQFQQVNTIDDSIIILFNYQFSLRKMMSNAQRVVGIFLIKQTFQLFKNRQKATSINIKPKLVWINKPIKKNITNRQLNAAKSIDSFHDVQVKTHIQNNNLILPAADTSV